MDSEDVPVDATGNGTSNGNGKTNDSRPGDAPPRPRPTLNSAVRSRRADRAFYMRLAGAIGQNEHALKRLSQ